MTFEEALKNLKEGKVARRNVWAKKKLYIECQKFEDEPERTPQLILVEESELRSIWNPGQTDIFAEDWEVSEPLKEGMLGYAFTWLAK